MRKSDIWKKIKAIGKKKYDIKFEECSSEYFQANIQRYHEVVKIIEDGFTKSGLKENEDMFEIVKRLIRNNQMISKKSLLFYVLKRIIEVLLNQWFPIVSGFFVGVGTYIACDASVLVKTDAVSQIVFGVLGISLLLMIFFFCIEFGRGEDDRPLAVRLLDEMTFKQYIEFKNMNQKQLTGNNNEDICKKQNNCPKQETSRGSVQNKKTGKSKKMKHRI